MEYVDTSVLVAALTRESATSRAQQWLGSREPGSMAVSDWVIAEFSAALSMKIRMKTLSAEDRARILVAFTRVCNDSLEVWPVMRADYRVAARFADQHASGLRAGDALHLAVAASRGAAIRTLDRTLLSAARMLGVDAAGVD